MTDKGTSQVFTSTRTQIGSATSICIQGTIQEMLSAPHKIKLFAVAFTVVVAGSLPTSEAISRERLNCNTDGSGPAINACAIERRESTENSLNKAIESLTKGVELGNKYQIQLQNAKWLELRDAECRELHKEDEGHTIWPSEFNDCLSDLTLKRVEELRELSQRSPMHHKLFMITVAQFATNETIPESDNYKIAFYCDKQTGAFFVSAAPDEKPKIVGRLLRHVVNWAELLKTGPEKNGWGDPLRTGSAIKTHRCGSMKINFTSGFLNANPQGELGAIDFPVISIYKGKNALLAPTAIDQCDVNTSRYSYFGPCPSSWAKSIEIIPAPKGPSIEVKRIYLDEGYNGMERIDVFR